MEKAELFRLACRRGRLQPLAGIFRFLLKLVLQFLLIFLELLGSVGGPSFALANSASGSM